MISCTVTTALRVGTIAATIIIAASESHAQIPTTISWSARPVGATVSGPGLTLLLPGPTQEIRVTFTVGNDEESKDSVILDSGFFRQLIVTLVDSTSGRPMASVGEWLGVGSCGAIRGCSVDGSIVLGPSESARFDFTLVPNDGKPLLEGAYGLKVELSAARDRILGADRKPWRGPIANGRTVPLSLREARTPAELRSVEMKSAESALARGDYAEALSGFQRVAAASPGDFGAQEGMGTALVALKRFREASTAYERALMLSEEKGKALMVPGSLAAVFYALGDDAKAEAVLRRYVAANALPDTIKRMKEAGAKLKSR